MSDSNIHPQVEVFARNIVHYVRTHAHWAEMSYGERDIECGPSTDPERLRRLAPMTAITTHRAIVNRVADAIAEEVADLEEVVGGNAGWERAAARAAIAELQALGLLDLPENGNPPSPLSP